MHYRRDELPQAERRATPWIPRADAAALSITRPVQSVVAVPAPVATPVVMPRPGLIGGLKFLIGLGFTKGAGK